MELLIAEIVRKLHFLPEVKILKVLDFVEFLNVNKERSTSRQLKDGVGGDEEFEAIADCLADEFKMHIGNTASILSDYAVNRAGIYEEHL